MTKIVTLDDLNPQVADKIFSQDYTQKPIIEGVKIISLKNIPVEDGNFCELLRINQSGEIEDLPSLKIAQINRSKINSQAVKGWHLHFKQDEIWYVSPSKSLLVGLWDVRKNSSTEDVSLKFVLGENDSRLVFIPRGVAHGYANNSLEPTDLYYFVSEQFNPQNPDEQRLPWDSLGPDFWQPKKE